MGEIYFAISQQSSSYGLSVGTCPTIGVSGHFSDGAFGVVSRKYADTVIDAWVVNASGYLLDSISNTDPDLQIQTSCGLYEEAVEEVGAL